MSTAHASNPNSTRSHGSLLLFFVLALCIYVVDMLLVRIVPVIPSESSDRWLVGAICFDFVIVVPLLYYALVIRKREKRSAAWMHALPIAALGGLLLHATLPSHLRGAVVVAEALLLPIEAVFLIVELRMALSVYRSVRRMKREGSSFPEAVQRSLGPGKLAAFVRHDLFVVYYLFGSWRGRKEERSFSTASAPVHLSNETFTYHRQTSLFLFAAMLTKVLVIESIVVHLFVRMLSDYAAWIMTAGSLWIIALLWADCRRSVLEPIRLTQDGVDLKYGLRLNGPILYSEIANVQSGMDLQPSKEERRRSAVAPMVTPNVRITMRNSVTLEGMLFQPREVRDIYIAVDDPVAFAESLRRRLSSSIDSV
ncbi:hypothetical protein DFQ01_10993 [Paenibacillus cellulosilyticus]|uniref:Uncharacterized protein n=1 Tax=Paenibacillus cellulosilyticus TaxID=375489 RepID=A0A2V2YT38_9BACL|nr:hypothetical protein [Paenibacillus cellulosilyticus]PWW02468.1 hypothetical protein DFQ01_10993 [Paenibacillus cellulosilyticus]QKS47174.1 hypothetical protein HUB94_22285 [Paenibacillus cellulosilyticus]